MNHEFCDKYLTRIKKHANEEFAAIMNQDRLEYLAREVVFIKNNHLIIYE